VRRQSISCEYVSVITKDKMPVSHIHKQMLNQPACLPSTHTHTHTFLFMRKHLTLFVTCETQGWCTHFKIQALRQSQANMHAATLTIHRSTTLQKDKQAVSHNMRDKSLAQYIRFANQELLNQKASDTAGLASAYFHCAMQLPSLTHRMQT
jgi:hypothetical protein